MSFFKQLTNAPLCNLLLYCVLFFLCIFIIWTFHTVHPDPTHFPLFPGLSHNFEPALPLKEEGERTEAGQKCGEVEGRGGRKEEKEEQEH